MEGRLDAVLPQLGLVPSRKAAKELILQGFAMINGKVCTKPSFAVKDGDDIKVTGGVPKYVGRGGRKLEKIIELCGLKLENCVCMDIGASTGGFTDCMLQNGAQKVYAVDVGSGQLDVSLCCDSRVVNMENTDIRSVRPSDFPVLPGFISADVSFISLRLILERMYELLEPEGFAAVLIKPQFEAGRENIGKNGIVKSVAAHIDVIADIIEFSKKTGFAIKGICYSPITGTKGNIEYLMCLKKGGDSISIDVKKLVDIAFEALKNGGR